MLNVDAMDQARVNMSKQEKMMDKPGWADFFKLAEQDPIVNYCFKMWTSGAFESSEQMLLSCVCALRESNEALTKAFLKEMEEKP